MYSYCGCYWGVGIWDREWNLDCISGQDSFLSSSSYSATQNINRCIHELIECPRVAATLNSRLKVNATRWQCLAAIFRTPFNRPFHIDSSLWPVSVGNACFSTFVGDQPLHCFAFGSSPGNIWVNLCGLLNFLIRGSGIDESLISGGRRKEEIQEMDGSGFMIILWLNYDCRGNENTYVVQGVWGWMDIMRGNDRGMGGIQKRGLVSWEKPYLDVLEFIRNISFNHC